MSVGFRFNCFLGILYDDRGEIFEDQKRRLEIWYDLDLNYLLQVGVIFLEMSNVF